MGIWDKSKLLDGARLDEAYDAGEAFVLYGMKVAGEVDLENGLPPATKTVLLTEGASAKGDGTWERGDGEMIVVGTLSLPIAEMASASTPEDFPVVVSWKKTLTKSEREATVLDYHGQWDGGAPEEVPTDWNRY